ASAARWPCLRGRGSGLRWTWTVSNPPACARRSSRRDRPNAPRAETPASLEALAARARAGELRAALGTRGTPDRDAAVAGGTGHRLAGGGRDQARDLVRARETGGHGASGIGVEADHPRLPCEPA